MSLDILNERGTPLDKQCLSWRELAPCPYSKLDDDAFTRVRVLQLHALEAQAVRFSHACALTNRDLRGPLAQCRRVEHLQQVAVNNLNPPDQSALETTLGYEQAAVELGAAVARTEPDRYLAQGFRFGMLDDLDHLYRFAALLDRLEGQDANTILQCYTDIRPGRPGWSEHGSPLDDLRHPYDRTATDPASKVHVLLLLAGAQQKRDYYLNVGPAYADSAARMLYGEIATVEEQHATQWGALADPAETWLEKWLLLETAEAYGYWSAVASEPNLRLRALWERFLDYELGHLHLVMDLMRKNENRDPEPLLPREFRNPLPFRGQREFIRETLAREAGLTALGGDFIPLAEQPVGPAPGVYPASLEEGLCPSELVALHYQWKPGGELFGEIRDRKELMLKEYFL